MLVFRGSEAGAKPDLVVATVGSLDSSQQNVDYIFLNLLYKTAQLIMSGLSKYVQVYKAYFFLFSHPVLNLFSPLHNPHRQPTLDPKKDTISAHLYPNRLIATQKINQ
jgi:hypothetical protein